jgi:hypothetical protein
MKKLNNLVSNKSVALVGPAAYMQNSGLGSEIENHDIVIRINRSIETTKKYPKDIGTRTDILYSCLIETSMQAGMLDVNELYNLHGVRLICCPPESTYQGISYATDYHHMVNKDTVKRLEKKMPVRIVDHEFHTDLAMKVKCRPNTEFMAIYDLLRSEAKIVSIYGFSFYLDGFIPGCKSGVEEEKGCTEQEFANMAFNSKRHIQKNMWKYAKVTLPNIENVKLDNTLTKILSMESLDREEFLQKVI